MFGQVTKYFKDKGYGFINGEDGNSYFVHVNNTQDRYLEKGYIVDFNLFVDKQGKQRAGNVIVVESDKE